MIHCFMHTLCYLQVKDTYFSLEHKMDETFLRKAVASHLMTLGHSVVIGHSANKVNLVRLAQLLYNIYFSLIHISL